MKIVGGILRAAGLLSLLVLAACETTPPVASPPNTPPVQRPDPIPQIETEIVAPSEASKALSIYYRRLQNDLLTQGLLRGDGGGPETPFTDTVLARNFVRIALFDEYVDGNILRPQATLARLRRWDTPVRMTTEFGPSTSLETQTRDRNTISAYARRLSRATGLSISQTNVDPNYYVLVLNEDERSNYADRLREIVPGIQDSSVRAITNLPRDQLCIVIAFAEGDSASYSKAVAVIRAEHPDLLRTTCFHEELAQGLGLANDSPQARPSIFNDDEEFGRLTTHDELLLEMLYDPRFRTGMAPDEAAPIARIIARELLDSGPS
jgi:hypothetical protein